jgi:hypothetical protein
MKTRAWQAFTLAVVLTAFCERGIATPPPVAVFIQNFEILSVAPAYGGATPPGATGPYEVITAVAHGELDPNSPANARIADLRNAPREADGRVAYSTDVVILRPVHAADAKRVLFYDVVNRGNKLAIPSFIGGGALTGSEPPPATFPSLLRGGVTVVWSGWQGDLPQTGTPAIAAAAPIGTAFPTAHGDKGAPITAISREEYIPDYAGGAANTIALSYPPADPANHDSVTLTARQSWLTHYGASDPGDQSYAAPSVAVADWHYAQTTDGHSTVIFTPPASVPGPDEKPVPADAGTIYSFVYRARDPRVNGIGFAAVRDLISFLRYDQVDAEGHANPIADLKSAPCVAASCPAHPPATVDLAIGEGISQSGRFLRDFLYQGFNRDAHGRRVFDGMMPIISGSRRTWINSSFSQPGRWSKQHEDHWQPGDQFPFAYNTIKDPVSGRSGGVLQRCSATHTCPRIMQVDGAFEWWGARASLVVTDGRGHDLKLPSNVRYYLVPGTMHGGGSGVGDGLFTIPAAGNLCQLPASPVAEAPVERALIPALIDWVTTGKTPPPSQYPSVADGTAVAPTRAATGFPDLSDVMVPSGGKPVELHIAEMGMFNQLFVTDYSRAVPVAQLDKRYTALVPKVDVNGNEVAGVLVPDVKVPVATFAGWNLRGEDHAVGESCTLNGGAIPLAVDEASQSGGHDSRATLESLYAGRADYQAKVAAAAQALVNAGYLLPLDAQNVFEAQAATISPMLVPKP